MTPIIEKGKFIVTGWRRWSIALVGTLCIAAVQWFGPGWSVAGAGAIVGVLLGYFGFDIGKEYFRKKNGE